MKTGLYRVVASIEIPLYEAGAFLTLEVRPPKIGALKKNDRFGVIQVKKATDDFWRAIIIKGNVMASIKLGENVPDVVFERVSEKEAVIIC